MIKPTDAINYVLVKTNVVVFMIYQRHAIDKLDAQVICWKYCPPGVCSYEVLD